jgi:mannosyltransferase OCH1-like enzyme
MIPKNIYFTYKNNKIPEIVFKRWEQLNEGFKTYFYDDLQCFNFIKENFGIDYANYFNEIKIGPYKADFWRLCIIYIKGGIYSDIDIVPHKCIEPFIKDVDVCTCLAMNKKSIFQAFIAAKPKNELIKCCLDSFYNKRMDKSFLCDLKNCSPTYDMYNVFLNFLKKNKLKSNKDYYVKNQIIRIFKETGENYHNAYVTYKGNKLFSSRDKDYVNMNLHGIPWGNNLPNGNYHLTCKKMEIKDEVLYLECLSINNKLIKNKIKINRNSYYENIDGFIYPSDKDTYINDIIPNKVYKSYQMDREEKKKFIFNNYNDIYNYYSINNDIIKDYLWGICIVHKYGGIYIDKHLETKIDYSYFLKNSDFVSFLDITNKINFNFFGARKNSKLLEYIIKNISDIEKYQITDKDEILEIGGSNNKIKILKIPGIIHCDNIPCNFQEKYCKDIFDIYVEESKELLYIHEINNNYGWKQNLKLRYYYKNISEVLNSCVNDYLFYNMLPSLDNKNLCDYQNYNKSIMSLEYNSSYSESL